MTLVQEILERVVSAREIRAALADLERHGEIMLTGLACSARSMVLAHVHRSSARPVLAITESHEEAEALLGDLEVCLGEERVFYFPETEVMPYDHRSPHVGLLGERIPTLSVLAAGSPVVVVTTVRALAGRVVGRDEFARLSISLAVGAEIPPAELTASLLARGFRRERIVEEIGTFCVRGGLVDLFPFGCRNPVRVEFFGDEIESIRLFDPASQRTVTSVESIDVLPQRELLADEESLERLRGTLAGAEETGSFVDGIEHLLPRLHDQTASLLDYLPATAVVVLDEPARLLESLEANAADARAAFDELVQRGHDLPRPEELFLNPEELTEALRGRSVLRLALFRGETNASALAGATRPEPPRHHVRMSSQETFRGSFSVLRERLRVVCERGADVYLLCDNLGQQSRLAEMLEELGERVRLGVAPLRNGFSFPEHGLVVLTDHELFARPGRRYRAFRYGGGAPIHDYAALNKGDFVVHADHGVGRYAGTELLRTGSVETECLVIRYQENDVLYVPIEQLNRVQKYIGGEAGEPPQIARLGSGQWEKTKARAKHAAEKMAGQLLEVHAARMSRRGHAFSRDAEWQREMEASFIYEETPDQRSATDAVKADMEDARPSDRLICGDVGYGKTEVAIRAAFKTVLDGKQVAVLVPTTILAQQHLGTFRERLRAYPVKVEMLSRFRTAKQQKEIVAALAGGSVDIVIGTHRLLSKDVAFRDLGLVIIDEEQRFGVRHKERLKEMRKLVDVITLTATPIPRTLNMALMGLRDISIINTPPPNKLPIVTEVEEASDEIIRRAIMREVQRGGQVFFVHNRVESIDFVADHLRELLPELRFDVAHGQMSERDLEKVMLDFLQRRSDVLVSTMIIESGLDLPNVNTILVNRADALGLAQLYQLRGRVGRSNHRAYAHLLIPEGARLSDVARKRLRAIEEFSELGAGFRLAMRDMEIRGVGNFLGPEQSGHVNAIGYDLYCELLREAVAEMRGEEVGRERSVVQMDVELDAYLPGEYVEDADQRIGFYKRLADLRELGELEGMVEELRDRYGRLPAPARNLALLKEMQLLAEAGGIERVQVRSDQAWFGFERGREPGRAVLEKLVRTVPGEFSFQADGPEGLRVRLVAPADGNAVEAARGLLRAVCASDTVNVSHVVN